MVASGTGLGVWGAGAVRFLSWLRTTCASEQDGVDIRAACAQAGVSFLGALPQRNTPCGFFRWVKCCLPLTEGSYFNPNASSHVFPSEAVVTPHASVV